MKNYLAALVSMAALSAATAFAFNPTTAAPPAATATAPKPAIAPAPAAATPARAAKTPFVVPANLETEEPFSPKKCVKRCMKELDDRQTCDKICGSGTAD